MSTIWGTSENVPIGPVCAPESWPCATRKSAPESIARRACLGDPHSATMRLPRRLHCSTKSPGAPMPQATSSTSLSITACICWRDTSLDRRKRVRMPRRLGAGTWYFSYSRAMNSRCLGGSSRGIVLFGHAWRQHQVDADRRTAGQLAKLGQLGADLVRRAAGGP
jgi:hypothetical protein